MPIAAISVCVGLGMGGRHTAALGRPIRFHFSSLAVAESGPTQGAGFRVRLHLAQGAASLRLAGNTAELAEGLTLQEGQTREVVITAAGPLGPEYALKLDVENEAAYCLHLLRYDPLERTLSLMEEMLERFERRGLDVAVERALARKLRAEQAALALLPRTAETPGRRLLYDASCAKRRLFFRDPDLRSLQRLLFVKRHAFEPSHNYSVLLDVTLPRGRWRVFTGYSLERRTLPPPNLRGRLACSTSRGGIARNPMANFDLTQVYFGYRPSADGYFHIMAMNTDGSEVKQITDGPFHDYWPCPLPDGGLAFISTRCRARFICWRPQAAVLFRMDARRGRHSTAVVCQPERNGDRR